MKRIVSAIREFINAFEAPARCDDYSDRGCGATDGKVCDSPYCAILDKFRNVEEPVAEGEQERLFTGMGCQ